MYVNMYICINKIRKTHMTVLSYTECTNRGVRCTGQPGSTTPTYVCAYVYLAVFHITDVFRNALQTLQTNKSKTLFMPFYETTYFK